MSFVPNRIKLSTWGNADTVKQGQQRGTSKMTRKGAKVFCTLCFKGMSRQEFKHHKRVVCPGAKGEMN